MTVDSKRAPKYAFLELLILCGVPLIQFSCPTAAQEGDLVETLVSGRQPGPPLWEVTKGEHTLWILPLGTYLPENIIWDNAKTAAIIAHADEFIRAPDISVGVSKALVLNPVNVIRGINLYKRIRRNPHGASLADVLPREIYDRFAVLKARYLPRNGEIETLRPLFAAELIAKEAPPQESLADFEVITRGVNELIHSDPDIRITEVRLEGTLEGSFEELSERIEHVMSSLSPEREVDCFESQLSRFENHLNRLKEVANAWATGNIDGIEGFAQPDGIAEECVSWLLASAEGELAERLLEDSRQRWLDAAVSALEQNRSTFTMLPMSYITGSMSLVDRLADLDYGVHAPLKRRAVAGVTAVPGTVQ